MFTEDDLENLIEAVQYKSNIADNGEVASSVTRGTSLPGEVQDIDAMLERGAAVLRDSGRLSPGDDELDRRLVLAVVDAVFPVK